MSSRSDSRPPRFVPHDAADLQRWLEGCNIDTNSWGHAVAKSVPDLWHEIERGESTLEGPPPLRQVTVVQLHIVCEDSILIEAAQRLPDGRLRQRNLVPSEKVLRHETPLEALYRGVKEELVMPAEAVTIISRPAAPNTRIMASPSYPGLSTRYVFYMFEIAVAGLPADPFWRIETSSSEPGMAHYWVWKRRDSVA